MPKLYLDNKFTKDALTLVYLAWGYPRTRVVSKTELTKFIRKYYPDVNDVQQARHLGAQKGYGKVSDKRNQQVIKSLPAGMKFDREQGLRFYDWYLKVSKEIFRILKPGGFFLSFSSPRLYHRMTAAIDDAGFNIRDCFLWIYTQNQVKAMSLDHFIDKLDTTEKNKQGLKKKLEGWKTPQIKSCFEPIAVAQKPHKETFLNNMLKHKVGLFNTNIRIGNNMYPSNILTVEPIDEIMDRHFLIPKPTKLEKEGFNDHQTVKPLSLCMYLIDLSTFSKDAVILDPFLGSGTTAIAAKLLGKKFIGMDINREYVAIAQERLRRIRETAAPIRIPQLRVQSLV